jgi:hypothetical protein
VSCVTVCVCAQCMCACLGGWLTAGGCRCGCPQPKRVCNACHTRLAAEAQKQQQQQQQQQLEATVTTAAPAPATTVHAPTAAGTLTVTPTPRCSWGRRGAHGCADTGQGAGPAGRGAVVDTPDGRSARKLFLPRQAAHAPRHAVRRQPQRLRPILRERERERETENVSVCVRNPYYSPVCHPFPAFAFVQGPTVMLANTQP